MTATKQIPQEEGVDHSLEVLSEGYEFIPNRLRKFDSAIFATRLLGQRAIVISGKDAAALFYDENRFQRKGAVPKRIFKSLFGVGGVQGLDDAAHVHRKQLFMSLMTPERIQILKDILFDQWQIAAESWESKEKIELFSSAEEIMCRTACQWAGVPLWANELKTRTKDLAAMVDAFGGVGPRYWKGKQARTRSENWMKRIILQVRTGKRFADEDTALYQMAWHRNSDGELISTKTAAVELINILRPIVAIGRFITFSALALEQYPETRQKLLEEKDDAVQMFVQEVRRFYPFAPFLGAKVRHDFIWKGYEFKRGTLVILDLYGTNHSPALWENPNTFQPERFKEWKGSPFDFIPQGGGDYDIGHRCAGEWLTVEAMKTSLEFLTKRIDYDVPDQDLTHSMVRMPTIPKSRFIIQHVIRKTQMKQHA